MQNSYQINLWVLTLTFRHEAEKINKICAVTKMVAVDLWFRLRLWCKNILFFSALHMDPALRKGVKFFCQLSKLVTYAFPYFITCMALLFPCKPPLMGSMLHQNLEECGGSYNYIVCVNLQKLIVASFEFIVSKQGTISSLHYAIYSLLMGIIYLSIKCESLSRTKNPAMAFREVQVLERVVNANIRWRLFPVTMGFIPIVQIFAGFAIVKLSSSGINWLKLAMFGLVFLEVLVFNLITVSSAANICNKSMDWLKTQKLRESGEHGTKAMRKFWRSCPPLKLRMGNNFVDRLTPLIVQQFCSVQTMSLILLSN